MQRFNLSAWAITHRALILFMMIVLAGAGIYLLAALVALLAFRPTD